MNVLDLFSGIGGFSLGLERAGMRTAAFCEIEPYCQRVLRRHWPAIPIFDDVRTLTAEIIADTIGGGLWEQSGRRHGACGAGASLAADHGEAWPMADAVSEGQSQQGGVVTEERQRIGDGNIDVICGGFPCQDISIAGQGAGLAGS